MKSPRLLAATTAAGLMTLGIAVPASADDTGTSTATVTVTGGALEISVKTAPRSLGSRGNSAKAATVSGSLGEVVVSDNRAAPEGSGWVASVVSTPFRSRTGPAIPASRVGYTAGKIDKVGTATYQANDPENLSRASAVSPRPTSPATTLRPGRRRSTSMSPAVWPPASTQRPSHTLSSR